MPAARPLTGPTLHGEPAGHPANAPPPGYAHPGHPPVHYHPGYPPPSSYDPRMGAPPQSGWPHPNAYGAPPVGYAHTAAVAVAAPPPSGHGQAQGAVSAAPPGSGPSDFARLKPQEYSAFVRMAIKPAQDGSSGTEVCLADGMCQDRHVEDFLQCVRCWLWHHLGDPRAIGRPWRLRRLDLSRNGLSDASVFKVVEQLQGMDLRVERLQLAGNGLEANALAKVTEYMWNCPDPLLELDLSSNQVDADPTKGDPGSDSVSALLRCLYNHPSYPQIVTGPGGVAQVLPLTLHLGGNRVKEPAKLLKAIEAKGGKKHVQIRPSPEPYEHVGKEYLSVCLPEFLTQQAIVESREHKRKRKDRSRSGGGQKRVVLTPAPVAARGGEKIAKSAKPEKLEKEKKSKKSKKDAADAKHEEPEHWRPGSPPGAIGADVKKVSSRRGEKAKKSRREAASPRGSAGSEGSPARGPPPAAEKLAGRPSAALVLSDAAQQTLQQEVREKLSSFEGLCSEDGTRDMLSEFVVCMAVAGKGSQEIQGELKTFLGDEAGSFVKWFSRHIQKLQRK